MIDIRIDNLESGHVVELLEAHRQEMFEHSPPESVHALDLQSLSAPEITFVSAWFGSVFAGCGALKSLSVQEVEIKSMRTVAKFLGNGVGTAVLTYLLELASQREYRHVHLETGSSDAFVPARCLYEKFGFRVCPPFGDYVADPNSVFMTLKLEE